MTVIKINAITVPAGTGDELVRRFAERAGAVDGSDGFEGFELLRPTDERTTFLVVTRWRDEAAFEAWKASPQFAHGHRGVAGQQAAAGGHSGATGGHPGAGGEHGSPGAQPPVAMQAELWSYEVSVSR
jgi:heme-degrading monooxygenase HmoA